MEKIFIGMELKSLRQQRGISSTAMVHALGITKSYLNQLEQNQKPLTPALSSKIWRAFSVEIRSMQINNESQK